MDRRSKGLGPGARARLVLVRVGLVAGSLTTAAAMYTWLYYADGDVPNLTFAGMIAQTTLAAMAGLAGVTASIRGERHGTWAASLGLAAVGSSVAWVFVRLAVWE